MSSQEGNLGPAQLDAGSVAPLDFSSLESHSVTYSPRPLKEKQFIHELRRGRDECKPPCVFILPVVSKPLFPVRRGRCGRRESSYCSPQKVSHRVSPTCSLRQNKPVGPKTGSGEQTRRSKRELVGSMKLVFIGYPLCARHIRKEKRRPMRHSSVLRNLRYSWEGNKGDRVSTEQEDENSGGCCTPGKRSLGSTAGSHTLGGATH